MIIRTHPSRDKENVIPNIVLVGERHNILTLPAPPVVPEPSDKPCIMPQKSRMEEMIEDDLIRWKKEFMEAAIKVGIDHRLAGEIRTHIVNHNNWNMLGEIQNVYPLSYLFTLILELCKISFVYREKEIEYLREEITTYAKIIGRIRDAIPSGTFL